MAALQRLWLEELHRGEPYSPAERRFRLEPVAATIQHHRKRNAIARACHTATRIARLSKLGQPPDAMPKCWQVAGAL
jgi:hypothetical protein